jgi:hypothetical protein
MTYPQDVMKKNWHNKSHCDGRTAMKNETFKGLIRLSVIAPFEFFNL